MICPIDGNELTTSDRHGVQIEYCPACRGVWLDRGELDKIIEAAYALPAAAPAGTDPPAVGVWADSIQPTPAPAPSNAPDIAAPSIPPPPSFPQPGNPNQSGPPIPNLGDLLAGLANVYPVRQGQIQMGQGQRGRKRPRGWLEEMFDVDLR